MFIFISERNNDTKLFHRNSLYQKHNLLKVFFNQTYILNNMHSWLIRNSDLNPICT